MKPNPEDQRFQPANKHSGAVAIAIMGGLHDGAAINLPDQPMCVVGRAPHCDIILRDESVASEHVAIVRDKTGVHIRALASGFGFEQRVIAPGDSIIVMPNPDGAAVTLGGIQLLIRQPVLKSSASMSASDSSTADDVAVEGVAANTANIDKATASKERRPYRTTLAFALFGVGSALTFAAFALSLSDSIQHKSAERLANVKNALMIPQLAGVKIIEEQGDKIALAGFVANDDENNLLRSRLKPGLVDSVRVDVGSDLAARAKELLRVNGYPAITTYEPHGKVRATLTAVDKPTQDRLADQLRKDLPMIGSIQIVSTLTAAEIAKAAGPSCVNPDADRDALKFVASFAADPAFVRTASGVKYYVDSRLPTGHEIREIRESEVVLECVGKFITIAL